MSGTVSFLERPFNWQNSTGNMEKQLENLSNAEIQKQFIKDKARGKEHVWQKRSHKNHLKNLRNLHEQSRGTHGMVSKKNP